MQVLSQNDILVPVICFYLFLNTHLLMAATIQTVMYCVCISYCITMISVDTVF